ncbi:uncharacterized protein LOC119604272 [Lucilia sericata]|uniref:uncharacterized protein LOC119604272 n=1 Tax=Lucilia sericata TaxID=13632 RepID=UPI0018A8537B|nr:uncharacterized protein LOC119604272 [Lucilia sericata]
MQNSCAFPATLQCKLCEFPPCNCEKCKKLRSEGKPDQEEIRKCFRSSNDVTLKDADPNAKTLTAGTSNIPTKIFKENLLQIRNFKLPTFRFTPSDLNSVLFDIVGIISFFIMTTFMFWITISQYLRDFVNLILQWGRRAQLTTLILLLLLCVSITFHAVKGRHHRYQTNHNIKKTSDPASNHNTTNTNPLPKCPHCKSCQRKKCSHFNLQNSKGSTRGSKESLCTLNNIDKTQNNIKSNNNRCDKCDGNRSENSSLTKKQNPSLCDLCAKQMKQVTRSILSDDEAREMYKKYRLYAVPTEMKTPPSFTNLIEFLTGLYNTISGSSRNAHS